MTVRFEQEVIVSEEDYVAIFSVATKRVKVLRLVAFVGTGIACLLWPYTVALGLAILVTAGVTAAAPLLSPFGVRSTYRRSPHLRAPMRCGVSNDEVWVHGPSYRFVSSWNNLSVWRESRGWVVLSSHGMSPVFLSTNALRHAGVYDDVIALARRHASQVGAAHQGSR